MTKKESKQWKLNQTIGWKSPNPDDFAVLFIKTDQWHATSDGIIEKRKFDEAVLQELKTNRLGDQAENDEQSKTDFCFIVSKDYHKVIDAIHSVAKTYKIEQQITVYKRDYQSYDKWIDKVVYPE